ncbi:2-C-methyl-D-erythritol 4-phosphate cytidylyltransferase [Kineobactrum sediminis]|uniref:2-C-methyl-D-erythritol 4-phosphate cytidylyltransferase n=1 Tax=Kineobactrum sediminis TaxID=1905677 RepID=A0A2N5Y1P5_9GAMM|nr:2-C-methyl-D-erythritol 4-phosphate cytidylyltransferase [Kineobactrum sediminis]PLW82302.1 2-C-methyl-D-erythritol 4-phosphate cytidylyltransferase [Kineobactrum sediminis]
MSKHVQCWGVVPAAGVGVRMLATRPKQYLEVAGASLLRHSLRALLACDDIRGIMVAVSPDDPRAAELAGLARVQTTPGGAQRADSVLAALHALQPLAADDDWVLVHDAARPCIDPADIRRLMVQVESSGSGALLAEPVVDTIKQVDSAGRVEKTLDRRHLWRAQTPQMFRLGELAGALAGARQAGVEVTDEASAMEWAGYPVMVVPGSSRNLKVTTPGDLEVAAFYLGGDAAIVAPEA